VPTSVVVFAAMFVATMIHVFVASSAAIPAGSSLPWDVTKVADLDEFLRQASTYCEMHGPK